jgi:hypothetical protein
LGEPFQDATQLADVEVCSDQPEAVWILAHAGHRRISLDTVVDRREIVEAAKGRIPILVDSRSRRGTDIAKALRMGATAAGVDRLYIWGLGAFGQPGVERALELLRIELRAIMQQVGAPTIKHLGAGHWC